MVVGSIYSPNWQVLYRLYTMKLAASLKSRLFGSSPKSRPKRVPNSISGRYLVVKYYLEPQGQPFINGWLSIG